MTKYLSSILGVPHSVHLQRMTALEQASLQTGIDIRLTTAIRQLLVNKMALLQLDPHDTTGHELYEALKQKAIRDDNHLRDVMGIKKNASSVVVLQKVAKYLSKTAYASPVWSLKRTVLKKLIESNPPTKTMKALHYRSLASMLKRESAAELYALTQLIEGPVYKNKIIQAMKKLKPTDFEVRSIEFICLTEPRWIQVKKAMKQTTIPVFSLPESSSVVVIPAQMTQTKCLALLTTALILKEVRHIKEHATYLKLRTLDGQLHTHMQTIAEQGHIPVLQMGGDQVYWHHLHRIFAGAPKHPEFLEPHVTAHDLQWLGLEEALASFSTELSFWLGTHNVAFVSDQTVVSLNVVDVCFGVLYDLPIDTSSKVFVQEVIKDELLQAYLGVPPFIQRIEHFVYELTDIGGDVLYD